MGTESRTETRQTKRKEKEEPKSGAGWIIG
jgi:hypothetical protein